MLHRARKVCLPYTKVVQRAGNAKFGRMFLALSESRDIRAFRQLCLVPLHNSKLATFLSNSKFG
jgi:hypothetical protein